MDREDFLDGCILGVSLAFALTVGEIWQNVLYYVCLFQQITVHPRVEVLRRDISIWSGFFSFIIVFLGAPSFREQNEVDCQLENWRLFPRKIVWLILFVVLAGVALYRKPTWGRIVEQDVLRVYWPAYLIGLVVILVIQRLLIVLFFRLKVYPAAAKRPEGHTFQIILIGLFALLLVSVYSVYFLPYPEIPNFIYLNGVDAVVRGRIPLSQAALFF